MSRAGTPGAEKKTEAHYAELRRRAAARSRARRKKTGEPAPGQTWLCQVCRKTWPVGTSPCPDCTKVSA